MERTCSEKTFYPVPPEVSEGGVGCSCNECKYMKMNTLEKVYNCLLTGGPTIEVEEEIREKAVKSIERMLELS
jgi:quinolinate synthase